MNILSCSLYKLYLEMKEGQMNDKIDRWRGLNQINTILTGVTEQLDVLNKNYGMIQNVEIDKSDKYLADLESFKNKYIDFTIKNPNPINRSPAELQPIYISVKII
jgi:hypothetical protein